ncbi:MAG: NAD(P)/FAD-dependent oxidoreductase [Pseudomonadota bacterium]
MTTQYQVVIVGSGFAGLCLAVQLKKAGIDNFVILEKEREFGGTWYANSYPGCAVDIPSILYSFSFAPNARWSHRFARQNELLDYTRKVAREFGLEPHIRLDSALQSADFNESDGYWDVHTSQGSLSARCLVGAGGALNRPAIPQLAGLEDFQGEVFHSARWNHGVALHGKRVAVIGTGASAVQFVPEIVGQVAKLDLFQRTAPWILPRPDRAIGAREQGLFARFKFLQRACRALVYLHYESRALLYLYAPRMLGIAEWMARRHLRRQVADPDLRVKLMPTYQFGCKRVLLASTFYPALTQPHVSVVTDPIARVGRNSIITRDGKEHAVDIIIFGTGFEVENALHAAELRGPGGRVMFASDLESYKGCAVAGFPNYFMITGPNTGLGHNSMIYMIESGVNYVVDAVRTMRERGLQSVAVKPEVQARYNEQVQRSLKGTVWSTGCRSWYLDKNGRNFAIWPGFTFAYRQLTRRFDSENYHCTLFRSSLESSRTPAAE